MPLYRVDLNTTIMVWKDSNDEDGAVSAALDVAVDEVQNDPHDGYSIREVKSLDDIPHYWQESIPWGDDTGGSECVELLSRPKVAEERKYIPITCCWCDEPPTAKCPECGKMYCENCVAQKCECRE
jgi:hypothetical protein